MEHAVTQVLLLLVIAAVVGMGARRVKLPYTLALVLAGIVLGLFHFASLEGLHLTPDLLLPIFMPALLFEAAYHVEFDRFRRDAGPILLFAVVGVLIAVSVTAGVSFGLLRAVGLPGWEPKHSLLLASMIAATDPISVLALFRTLGVDRRLYMMVEGESLLNDGVAVVIFVIVAAVYGVGGGHGHAPDLHGASDIAIYGVRTFLWMAGVGLGIGASLGMVVSVLTRQVDDRLIEVVLSFVLAYGSFIAAEHLHASGVLAVVAGGVVLGSFGSRYGMSASTRIAVVDFWEFMAFFANSFVFLLVGIELDVPELLGAAGFIALAFVAVVLGRAAAVYGLFPFTRWMRAERIPASWSHVFVWGGLRGSLSMVLVIGLPADFPGRGMLLLLVFGTVSISLFLQGLTMKPLLARLGITESHEGRIQYEQARARAMMAAKALRELESKDALGQLHPTAEGRLSAWYRSRRDRSREQATALAGETVEQERIQEAALHVLSVEEDALRHGVAEGVISAEAAEDLFADVARRRERLRHGDGSSEELVEALQEVFGGLDVS